MTNLSNDLSLDRLNKLSTAELKEILRRDAESTDSESTEVVSAVLSILHSRNENDPNTPPVDAQAAWERFQKYYNTPDGIDRALFTAEPQIEQAPRHKAVPVMKRILAVAAVIALFCTLSIPVIGSEKIGELLGHWKDGLFTFLYNGETKLPFSEYQFETDNADLQKVYDAVADLGVTKPVVPSWIPDGYSLIILENSETRSTKSLYAVFENQGKMIIFALDVYDSKNNEVHYIDQGDSEIYEISGINHYIMPNFENWVAAWGTDNVKCTLTAMLDKEDFMNVLKSVYRKGK